MRKIGRLGVTEVTLVAAPFVRIDVQGTVSPDTRSWMQDTIYNMGLPKGIGVQVYGCNNQFRLEFTGTRSARKIVKITDQILDALADAENEMPVGITFSPDSALAHASSD